MKTTKKAFFKLLQKAATPIAPSTAPKSTKSGCCTGKKTRSRNPSSKCRQGIIAFIDTGDTMKLFLICSAIQVSAVGTTEGHEPNIQPQVVMSLPSDGCALQPVANREQISK
jgi:hypothetical protein